MSKIYRKFLKTCATHLRRNGYRVIDPPDDSAWAAGSPPADGRFSKWFWRTREDGTYEKVTYEDYWKELDAREKEAHPCSG